VPRPGAGGLALRDPAALVRLLVRVALVLTPVVFVPGLVEGFEMPKAAVLRVLGVGAAVLVMGLARTRRRAPLRALDYAVLAWLGVELLTSVLSLSPWISVMGDRAQHEGLLTSVALAALYFGARATTRDAADARATLDAFLIGVSLSGLYALLQVAHLDPVGWQRTATYGEGGQLRPFGTLGHANMLGPLTGAGAIVALLGMRGATPGRRVALALAGAMLVAVTFATLSRGAWLGAAAGLLVAIAVAGAHSWIPSGSRARWTAAAILVVAIGILVLLLRMPGWGGLIAQRLAETLSASTGSSRSRLEIWRTALAMAANRPWLGQGPDTFTLRFPTFQSPDYWRFEWGGLPYHAHSIYLHTLATRGVAGLLAGAACLVAWLATAGRALGRGPDSRGPVAALAGVMAGFAVAGGFGALGLSGAAMLAVGAGTLGALADGPWIAAEPAATGPAAASDAVREAAGPGIPLMAAALLMIPVLLAGVTELRAERSATLAYLEVLASPEDANLPYAIETSGRAMALMPQQDSYAQLHAQCLFGLAVRPQAPAGMLSASEDAAREAVRRQPLRAPNWQMLALVLGARAAHGDAAAATEARRAWARHHELAPHDAVALIQEADLAIRLGDARDALALSRQAAALYPDDGPTLFRLSGAQGWAGDSLGAVETLRRAVAAGWRGDDQGRHTAEALLDSVQRRPAFR
jgi:O-antigen ligase